MKKTFLLTLMMMFFTSFAYAGNTALPFESSLTTIANSLSGPVAMAIGIAAFAVAGIAYVFTPDMNGIVKGLIGLCVALGIIFGGKSLIDILFKPSSTGNLITITDCDKNILSDKILSDKISLNFDYEQDI